MKRIILYIIVTLAVTIMFGACNNVNVVDNNVEASSNYYIHVSGHPEVSFIYAHTVRPSDQTFIVYNEESKVMYAVSNGSSNSGNMIPLYNADGTFQLFHDEK